MDLAPTLAGVTEPATAVDLAPTLAGVTELAMAVDLALAPGATGHCATEDVTLLAARRSLLKPPLLLK